jgi:hypothetical protein
MIRKAFVLAAATAASALALAAPASATPVCNETTIGEHSATVCANVNSGSVAGGVIADASTSVLLCLDWSFPCQEIGGATVGPTGFVPGSMSNVEIDPRVGGIRSGGGTIGTVYLHGMPFGVHAPSFCFGPPGYCPGGGLIEID